MRPSRGVVSMIASAAGFSVMSLLVKVAAHRGLPTGEVVLARAVVTLAISVAMVRRAGVAASGTRRGRLFLRGVLGFGGLAGYYLAIAHLPLADATTLQNIVPLLTALLAWRLLGERVGGGTAIALACGLAGVVVVANPTGGDGAFDAVGVVAALGGAVCSAFAYVTVRELSRTEPPLVIVMYFPIVSVPLAIPWALSDWVTPAPIDWLLLAGIGAATQVGQVFLTLGLAAERAGRASSVNYVQIVFAMAWQLAVFGDVPTPTTIAGAALIIAGTLVVASRREAAA
jgi:drug/metabolite transporter (DMT)-like permease|nr:DMT family transporter [Kofleriaceae bacterium]